MINLKNKYENKKALLIMGGASIMKYKYDLKKLSDLHDIVFLESKALTPKLIDFNINPDYYLMFFPEKSFSNSLQQIFIQALSCNFDLEKCLKQKYVKEWINFKKNHYKFLKINKSNMLHKKYVFKTSSYLKNTPVELINFYPNMKIITEKNNFFKNKSKLPNFKNKIYFFKNENNFVDIDIKNNLNSYNTKNIFSSNIVNEELIFKFIPNTLNSSTMYLYNLIEYFGFSKCTIVGMDMSLLGSMEYSSQFTFKSMRHFSKFYNKCKNSYSYSFPRGIYKSIPIFVYKILNDIFNFNFSYKEFMIRYDEFNYHSFGLIGKFMRTKKQLNEMEFIFSIIGNKYTNIFESEDYTSKIPVIRNVSYDEFLKNLT